MLLGSKLLPEAISAIPSRYTRQKVLWGDFLTTTLTFILLVLYIMYLLPVCCVLHQVWLLLTPSHVATSGQTALNGDSSKHKAWLKHEI